MNISESNLNIKSVNYNHKAKFHPLYFQLCSLKEQSISKYKRYKKLTEYEDWIFNAVFSLINKIEPIIKNQYATLEYNNIEIVKDLNKIQYTLALLELKDTQMPKLKEYLKTLEKKVGI